MNKNEQPCNRDMDNQKVMVAIRCITYNHEPYIRDALEGFVMQKTNFPFVAIVHDDASTDGTAAIIKEYAEKYPDIIKPIYETENQYSKRDGSLLRIMNEACEATGAKYIATCEGDDYWTDPLKLQKQVDILNQNPEVGMVYTDFEFLDQVTDKIIPHLFIPKSGWQYESMMLEELNIWTLTNCSRAILWKSLPTIESSEEMFKGDMFLFLSSTAKMKVACITDKTAVYRRLPESASHFTDPGKALHFGYTVANTINWFLENGPEISKDNRSKIKYRIVKRRLKYAIYYKNKEIIKSTQYPIYSIKSIKQFLLFIFSAILRMSLILQLCNMLYVRYLRVYVNKSNV